MAEEVVVVINWFWFDKLQTVFSDLTNVDHLLWSLNMGKDDIMLG